MKTRTIALPLVIMLVAGCASYNARGVLPMSASTQQKGSMVESDDFVIRGFPVLTKEDSKIYFDENLPGDHILGIFLEVFSKSSNEVKIVSLELKIDKTVLQPSTADEMYKVVKREYVGKACLWMLPTAFVGGPISAIHTYRINQEIERDIKEKEFGKEVKPFGTSGGFIWFKIPNKVSPKDKGEWFPKGMVLKFFLAFGEEKKLIELPIS